MFPSLEQGIPFVQPCWISFIVRSLLKKYNKNPCERLHFQLHKILVKSSENLKLMNYEYKSSKYTLLLKAFRGLTEAIQGIAFSHFYCSVLEAFLLASTASANQGGMPYHTTASKNLFSKMELNPDEIICLDVGGEIHYVKRGLLARWVSVLPDIVFFRQIILSFFSFQDFHPPG